MKSQENTMLYVNPSKCLGCHTCEMACAVAHGGDDGLFEAVKQQLPLQSRTKVIAFDDVTMPMQCRQCDNAPCATVCPTDACKQLDGIVQMNEESCIGCKLCIMVCPFGAITVSGNKVKNDAHSTSQGFVVKCDLCRSWRATNDKSETACVEACPTKAIKLLDLKKYREELIKVRARELMQSHKSMKLLS